MSDSEKERFRQAVIKHLSALKEECKMFEMTTHMSLAGHPWIDLVKALEQPTAYTISNFYQSLRDFLGGKNVN